MLVDAECLQNIDNFLWFVPSPLLHYVFYLECIDLLCLKTHMWHQLVDI